MAGAQEIGADIFATPEQIAGRFFLLGGNVNGGERVGPIEDGELGRIATVSFDAIARAARNKRRRDDITEHALRCQRALQLEATRAGFVAALYRAETAQPLDEAQDRAVVRCERMQRRRAVAREHTAATVVAAW
jgi:hypothetical protein